MMTTARRRADCMIEAYKIARSGHYPDHYEIEAELLIKYPEAHPWFALETVVLGLRNTCEEAFRTAQQAHALRTG